MPRTFILLNMGTHFFDTYSDRSIEYYLECLTANQFRMFQLLVTFCYCRYTTNYCMLARMIGIEVVEPRVSK